jgi:rare lipoprotein A
LGPLAACLLLLALASGCARLVVPMPPPGPSRHGPSYEVNGRTYHTLATHAGYLEEGFGSWYGLDFHGRSTSSGEPYDMHALTAAHKTLPLQCWVRVCNLTNGREVEVRVNDRGPFVDGRIIDLSLAGAQALGMEAAGVVPVRVRALGFREGDGWRQPTDYDSGDFTIQVGAFRDPANASRLRERLSSLGEASVSRFDQQGQTLYRVRVAHYKSLAEAKRAQEQMRRQGFPDAFAVAAD